MRMTSVSGRGLALGVVVAMLALQSARAAGGFSNGQAASVVLGQSGFGTNTTTATATAGSLHFPSAAVVDGSGNVWIADRLNNRVLQFKPPFTNGASASVVLGQPDLTSNAQNNGGRTASSLSAPNGLAIDPSGNLWVADAGANNRVLRFSPPFTNFMAASAVLGAPDFTSVIPGTTQTSFSAPGGVGGPAGLAFDSSGNLWVTDDTNNRVLRFNAPFTNGKAASIVLGQANFTSGAAAAPPTASSLKSPESVAVDSSGNVWIADYGNNRVLKYGPPLTNGQAASLVIGQTQFTANSAATPPTSSSLKQPFGVAVDAGGHLWVTDGNSRLLQYDPPFANGQAAAVVLGQPDFVSNAPLAPPTANSLGGPVGAVAVTAQQLWVADHGNNRVLAYTPASDGGGGGHGPGDGTNIKNQISPPDFPYKVTAEFKCIESLAGVCLQSQLVKVCVGGNCFAPPQPGPPPCLRCFLGASAAVGALGGIGAMVLMRRRRP